MRLAATGLVCSRTFLILCHICLEVSEGFLSLSPPRSRPRAMATKLNDRDCQGESLLSPPMIFPSDVPLPSIEEGVTVLSFNVLLPNGNDGWWIYKNYQPHVPEEHRTWPFRQALMRDYLLRKDADIVCIQEASAETFEEDFAFMRDAGYASVLHTKFRFRSATFFKSSRLELACEKHKDRVLITGLRTIPPMPTEPPLPPGAPQASPPALPPAAGASSAASDPAAPRSDDDGAECGRRNDRKLSSPESSSANAVVLESPPQGEGEECSGTKSTTAAGRLLMVVNCHLTGGPAPERRMRQVFDALDTARKEANRLLAEEESAAAAAKGSKGGGNNGNKGGRVKGTRAAPPRLPTSVPVVVSGDLNSDGPTAVSELLKTGMVEASFRELGYPDTAITSKGKRQAFGEFGDVYEEAYGVDAFGGQSADVGMDKGWARGTAPPATFLVPLLHPHFLAADGEELSSRLQIALTQMFNNFSSDCDDTAGTGLAETDIAPFLPRRGVEAWLLRINRALGRGSEFRAAEALMGPGPGGGLTLEDFLSIYSMELREGKFWGVAHDLYACGVELPGEMPWVGPYTARFDRIFYSKATLEAIGAMESLSAEERLRIEGGDCLPNSWHPSDHLAVAGAFRFRQRES